jgi:hypothetical protein
MMHIIIFINTDLGIKKLLGADTHTQWQEGDIISLLFIFFK